MNEQPIIRARPLTIRQLMIAVAAVAFGSGLALLILDAYPDLRWRSLGSPSLVTALALGALSTGLLAITLGFARTLGGRRLP